MRDLSRIAALALLAAAFPATVSAAATETETVARDSSDPSVLQCVPYARRLTGITIFGDAHTWWGQAQGKYARGHVPKVGAVLAIRPHANSRLGHVAAVSRVIDARTILISHANWSSPGQIETNVTALDVSPANNWSEVRVWFGPGRKLGTTHWPVAGFIYGSKGGGRAPRELADSARASRLDSVPIAAKPATAGKRRHKDPIGAIIAGTY